MIAGAIVQRHRQAGRQPHQRIRSFIHLKFTSRNEAGQELRRLFSIERDVMIESRPSITAQRVALRRAAHQVLDNPRVFEDPLALRIAESDERQLRDAEPRGDRSVGSRALRAFIAARSRYAEDELARAVARGVRQYVTLGAGLDTFAYRNPHCDYSLRVFEV